MQLCFSWLETELNLDPDPNQDPESVPQLITDPDPNPSLQIISDPAGSGCTTLVECLLVGSQEGGIPPSRDPGSQ
jgi:hypothetical protein